MKRLVLPESRGPERIIQDKIIAFLRAREWLVLETHGNLYQHGFPDLFATHYRYGARWIEIKNPASYSFTPAQLKYFPQFCANGSGVWIMVDATESEYAKIFKEPNWVFYLMMLNQRGAK